MKRLLVLYFIVVALTACSRGGALDLNDLSARARAGDAKSCRELVALLGMAENQVGEKVYPVVIEIGEPMVEPLLARVRSDNRDQRERVIAALGTLRTQAAVQPISQVLQDKTLERRYVAAWALGEIGDDSGIRPLLLALGDREQVVRQYATRALIKFNRSAVEPLIAFLPRADSLAAAGAIRALGDIADPRALDVLLAQVGGPNRRDAVLALGKLHDPRAEKALISGLQDADWMVRMNAAMALGPIGGPEAVSPLTMSLEDDVMVVREWSARSLSVITGHQVKYRDAAGDLVEPYSVYH